MPVTDLKMVSGKSGLTEVLVRKTHVLKLALLVKKPFIAFFLSSALNTVKCQCEKTSAFIIFEKVCPMKEFHVVINFIWSSTYNSKFVQTDKCYLSLFFLVLLWQNNTEGECKCNKKPFA